MSFNICSNIPLWDLITLYNLIFLPHTSHSDLYFERDHEGPSIHEVKRDYYDKISESAEASIAKLFDRCHNVSSMAGTFTKQTIQEYIAETETYVLPLIKITKEEHPEYQNVLFVLKYHIWSVLDAIKGTIQTYSEVVEHES